MERENNSYGAIDRTTREVVRVRKLTILVLQAVIVLSMLGGMWASVAKAATETLDIGIATPLTGPSAHLGTMMKNGTLMAIDDQNERGGVTITGKKYVLNAIVRDTKKDTSVGKAVAEELVYDKKVKIIVGPFLDDMIGVQSVTERNKVIVFFNVPAMPGLIGPDKPYTFFFGGIPLQMMITGAAYIQKFYPGAKTVVSMVPDTAALPVWENAVKGTCGRYGLNWLGNEKFPFGTTDFSPFITRVLARKPDIVDTSSTGGSMGGLCAQLIKQLRQAGFKGIIWVPATAPPGTVEEVVPKEYRIKIVTNDIDWESPIVSKAYRDLCRAFQKKYNMVPIDMVGEAYNGVRPFFKFLDGQDSMDTTVWTKGFEKYQWPGIFGREAYWVGKPIYGINRILLRNFWASEYIDGKLETRWEAPIPLEVFVEK
jgi:branched-chain amino acid transport system substrate-binding protein